MYISINGILTHQEVNSISPMIEGFMYGYGLFETIKIHQGKMIFFDEHMERLFRDSGVLRLQIDMDPHEIQKHCAELIAANGLTDGALKVMAYRDKLKTSLIITTREFMYNKEQYKKGFALSIAETKRNPYSPITYIKSNNYAENIWARRNASEQGFDEAVFLNVQDKLCEGTISNIFFVKKEKIYTPSKSCGILPGIMRRKINDLATSMGIPLVVGEFMEEDLYEADEVFITNSLMDIMPVSRVQNKYYDLCKNQITQQLMYEFEKIYENI